MHYFIYPEKDTFITSKRNTENLNNGFDEILQIEKSGVVTTVNNFTYLSSSISGSVTSSVLTSSMSTTHSIDVSRTLMKFDLEPFYQKVLDGDMPDVKFTLNLKTVDGKNLSSRYTIISRPISGSWEEGTGRKYEDSIPSDGVTWQYRSSIENDVWENLGGDFYTDVSSSQTFSYETSDIKMDVTNIVMQWISGSYPNDGLILMQSDETSSIDLGSIRFFSSDTNTIYYPYIDVSWQDSEYNPNTSSILQNFSNEKSVSISNVSPEYSQDSVIRFNVMAREKYPQRTFQKWPNRNIPFNSYLENYSLPSSSYFKIRDYHTDEIVIDYSDHSKLSSDYSGSYFYINAGGLPQERFYKISIKVTENENVNIYDISTPFKIRR